ncbi:unnamed protein product [Adineta steineri]|uniref:Uncharacterized protein n=1 Tax=Adineta steineri TaxID=433720 RepID=A0A813URP8_9BILA|nr:unnamed protein product [Adineta steineri]CAF3649400.1 unnamed protein product [Adineta steineri]
MKRPKTKYQSVPITDNHIPESPFNHQFRFVDKNGHINTNYSSLEHIKNMHSNIILFIMKSEWWIVLTLVLFGFVISWFFFAFLYFLVSIEHGDFVLNEEQQALLDNQTNTTRHYSKTEREKCVQDVHNFLSALLFSIETQHTIGYGSRYITTECMGGILVLTLQSSLGYLLQVIVTQIVFTKLSRPKEKSQFVVFSDKALIVPRGKLLTMTFRIGNLSASQLIFAGVRLLMIRKRRTLEGEIIPHHIYDMEISHLRNGQLFFPRPIVVEHIINSRSPLYGVQRDTVDKEHFEIIAIIEGSFDYTGFSCHFRTSYLPNELVWGFQFSTCQSTLSGFDFAKFNDVKLVYAYPIWNYEEQEEGDNTSTTPSSPINPVSFYSKYLTESSYYENLPRQKSADETSLLKKRFRKLETIKSFRSSSFKEISIIDDYDDEQSEIEKLSPTLSEQNNQLAIYRNYPSHEKFSIEYQKQEINHCADLLQQWLDNYNDDDQISYETDVYFDCVEQFQDECDPTEEQKLYNIVHEESLTTNSHNQLYDDNFIPISTTDQPWLSEIWLSVHRKTSLFRRFINYFYRSGKHSLPKLAEEFVRLYAGHFDHPVGFRFHISYEKEKWLLILTNITLVHYSVYPYPSTRIVFTRKGLSYIAR